MLNDPENPLRPEVSIITPAYNAERFIRDCIDSVLDQGVDRIEHIVVDDGSDDGTAAIAEAYGHIRYRRTARGGANAARNLGIGMARGRYVKFLDADDMLLPAALERQIRSADRLPEGMITYGRAQILDDATGTVTEAPRKADRSANHVANLIMNNIRTSLPLYPIGGLKDVSGFDPRMHANQEWHLNIKLACSGYRFVDDGIPVYKCRQHDGADRISNRALDIERELRNLEVAYEAIGDSGDPDVIDAWSSYLWCTGRVFAGKGRASEASVFFDKARRLSPTGYTRFLSRKYRLLRMLSGSYLPDRLLYLWRNRGRSSRG